jgi:hypothetical protein
LPIKTARAQSISGVVMIMVRRRRGTLKRAHKWSMQRAQARNPTNRDRQRRIDKDDVFFGGKVARSQSFYVCGRSRLKPTQLRLGSNARPLFWV